MAQIEQKGRAVFLGRDRIVDRGRPHLKMLDREFAAAGSALVLANYARDFERSFLSEMVGGSKGLGAEVVNRRHALAHSGAVANEQEMDLSARTMVVEPSLERDFRADVAA